MKERVWIHVDKKYETRLEAWNSFYRYDSVDDKIGEVVAFEILTDDTNYKELIELLNSEGILFSIFRRDYQFTKKEIENSEILKLIIDANAGESYSVDHSGYTCPCCGERLPNKHNRNLHVDYNKIKKYDISTSYIGDTEIIVSEKLRGILYDEKISGVEFLPIFQIGKNDDIINGFYHLKLSDGIGEIVNPSVVEKEDECCECNFYRKFLCQTPLFFKRQTWQNIDICLTQNWFGEPPLMQGKWVIISNRLYKILKKHKIKMFTVEPAFLID